MRRVVMLSAMFGILAVLALGSTAAGRGKTVTVNVDDDFFSPTPLVVKQDTTVNFTWVTDTVHDVTKRSGPGRFFESGPQQGEGYVYSRKFRKPGNYEIICTLHEEMTMDLKVKRPR